MSDVFGADQFEIEASVNDAGNIESIELTHREIFCKLASGPTYPGGWYQTFPPVAGLGPIMAAAVAHQLTCGRG